MATSVARRQPPPGFRLGGEIWNAALSGLMPQAIAAETLQLEAGERHSPGASRFYLLRGDWLHISTEVGRNGR